MANIDYTADGYITGTTNQTVAVTAPYTEAPAPDYKVYGGYDPDAVGGIGGGYDPDNPSYGNQTNSIGGDVAVSETFTGSPNFNAVSQGGWDPSQGDEIYTGGGYDPSLNGLNDPTNARLQTSGLKPGGANSDKPVSPSVAFQSTRGPAGSAKSSENDWRVRVSLADNSNIFYRDPSGTNAVMAPLIPTNGVIFPYTPQINISHAANYTQATPTHSNYPIQFYNNSEVQDIQISGEFTVQSVEEGRYLMAAIYFFRSATKMFFGQGSNVGNPPPIVFLDGYGSHYFPHVPCVVSNFTHTLGNDVDYIQIPITTTTLQDVDVQADNLNVGSVQLTAEEQQYVPSLLRSNPPADFPNQQLNRTQFQNITTNTRVPTNSTISIMLRPVYSRSNLHNRFDLNKFASGLLLQDRNKGYGGFI